MKSKKEYWFDAFDIHTFALNNDECSGILFVASGYLNGEEIELTIEFNDYNFLKFISHHEIDEIKENLKKRIDKL
jgi:hypothetical protein